MEIDDRLKSLKEPRPNTLYFAITLTADEKGKIVFGTMSQWAGWTEGEQHYELRRARLVYPEFVKAWEHVGEPYCVIHSTDEMTLFLVAGGNALVEKELAERVFPDLLGPHPSLPDYPNGFTDPKLLNPCSLKRAPTPRVRMEVLKRDDRRCRICGRRPDDDVDLELHVHHIRPWAKGGITDPVNLITLCHTCHNGLHPHEDHSLFNYAAPRGTPETKEARLAKFHQGVANFRKVGFLGNLDDDSDNDC